MTAINKIKDLIQKLESGDPKFIKEFQNKFSMFEKEYDKELFFNNTFDYSSTSNEILMNSKDNNWQSINQDYYLKEIISTSYYSLVVQNSIKEFNDKELVLAA